MRDNGICLRPLEESDITERYLSWFRDETVTRFLESRNISRDDALQFMRWGKQTGNRRLFAICVEATGLHIGNIKVGDIDQKASTSDLVTFIGDRDYWGRGIATTAIRLATAYAFKELGVRKLHAGMYAQNLGSLKCYTRAGWLVEAVLYYDIVGPDGPTDRFLIACFNPDHYKTLPSFPRPLPKV